MFLLAENRLLQEVLAGLLAKKNDIQVVVSVSLSSQVIERIAEVRPDVLLLDAAAFLLSAFGHPTFVIALRFKSIVAFALWARWTLGD